MARHYYSKVSSKGQITLPLDVRRRLGIRSNDRVAIEVDGDVVTISRGRGLEELWSRLPAQALARPLSWKG